MNVDVKRTGGGVMRGGRESLIVRDEGGSWIDVEGK